MISGGSCSVLNRSDVLSAGPDCTECCRFDSLPSLASRDSDSQTVSLPYNRRRLRALGVLPENRIQLLCVDGIRTGEIHLGRFLRTRSFLVVPLEEKPAAQILVVRLIGRLRSRPGE